MGWLNSIANKLDDMVTNWTISQVESTLDDLQTMMQQVESKSQIREYNTQFLRDVMALKSVDLEDENETLDQNNDIKDEDYTENNSLLSKAIKKWTNDAISLEAAREKIKHFLRKFILFFVSLFVILFHFLKATVTSLFILPITYNQLTTCFTSFVSTNCIGKRKLGNPEVFK